MNLDRFRAVIFDMDGLLLDTERVALAAFEAVCERCGLADHSHVFTQCVGADAALLRRILRDSLGAKTDPEEFARFWDEKIEALIASAPVPLKAGAADLLGRLSELGVTMVVATSTPTATAVHRLRLAGLTHPFRAVVGGDKVDCGKPHPAIYLRAAEAACARPAECLAIEDSDHGVRSAVAAGMSVIHVPDLVPAAADLGGDGYLRLESLHAVLRYLVTSATG
jgi:HAD superfamily hydrolase (TIGR01509 family)